MEKIKSVHGHYASLLEEEAKRLRELCQKNLGVEISWKEATALAARRSQDSFWTEKKLKDEITRLRI